MKAEQDSFGSAPFSVGNRVARAFWGLVAAILFRYSPRPFFRWRAFLLTCFGAKLGHGVKIYPRVEIWAPWNLEIGDECGIGNDVILYSQGKIKLGNRAVVSQGANLCTGTHDYTKTSYPLITMPITIGEYAWIAAEAFIHPGVNIGAGCIIGARSVVTKNMPEWMVCTGNPCKPVKTRVLVKD